VINLGVQHMAVAVTTNYTTWEDFSETLQLAIGALTRHYSSHSRICAAGAS